MDNGSQEILRKVTQDDASLNILTLVDPVGYNIYGYADGKFYSDNSDDYSTLGAAIANNTHLERLEVQLSDDLPLGVADRGFYDGLKRNASIHKLMLRRNVARGVAQEILKVYQENNSQLTFLSIIEANLQNGGDRVIVDTLRSSRNLQRLLLNNCSITDEQLLPIVDAIRVHCMLEDLRLVDNNIGNAGCDAIAELLADPNFKLRSLNLGNNAITAEGAIAIANSLINNNQLQQLYLYGNPIDQIIHVFSNVLCNTSSIEQTYSSNHTLETLMFDYRCGQHLTSLLSMNMHTNKSLVAIKKILKYHPNIDMEPQLFEWDAEGEHTLKALPHIINWFERAGLAVANEVEDQYNVDGRKLNAIFQFAKSMPLLLGGIATIKRDDDKVDKRKRID